MPAFVRKMLAAKRLKLADTPVTEYGASNYSTEPILAAADLTLATVVPILAPREYKPNSSDGVTQIMSTTDLFDNLVASYVSVATSQATLSTSTTIGAVYSETHAAT